MHSRPRLRFNPIPALKDLPLSQITRSRRSYVLPILIAIVAIALIIFGLTGGDDKPDAAPAATPNTQETDPAAEEDYRPTPVEPTEEEKLEMYNELANFAKREADDPLAMGDIEAPLTMIVYSDFRCPYCGQWERETLPVLVEKYVETGQMRIEWHDMPVLGDASVAAAHAARAAGNQGQFWEFTAALYDADFQKNATDADYEAEAMAEKAAEMGMDSGQFLKDIEEAAFAEEVEADLAQAWGIGFTGTPAFLIEGVPVMGAQPIESFEGAIQYRMDQLQAQS